MPDFPALESPRLRLREIVPADAPALYAIHGDARHMQWFGADALTEPAAALRLVELFASWRALPNPGTRWGLEPKCGGGLIGSCGLFAWNRAWRKCTIGFELAPQHTGAGLMREALGTVIGWGLQQMALNRIEAQVHPDNAASLALLERLGFVREGLLRQVGYWAGAHHSLYQYALLRADWPRPPSTSAT